MYSGRYISHCHWIVVYVLLLSSGMNGKMYVFVTEAGSPTVTVPPGTLFPVAVADPEAEGLEDELLLHAAMLTASSAAAPAAAACARRGRGLIRNIKCAPWL